MLSGKGSAQATLTEKEIMDIIGEGSPTELYKDKKILVLTPEATRTCPLPMMVRTVNDVIGPVFPHEVAGYFGGTKYLFPGISGGEFLHFFHWLGAVITCEKIIGTERRRAFYTSITRERFCTS